MREIRFRGKDIWGNWRYGDLMKNSIPTASPVIVEDFYYDDPDDSMFEVNPDTVGQSTGLVDSEGREIYEGDIVKLTKPTYTDVPVVITWEDGAFMVDHDLYLGGRDLSRGTVIGNVHDNPELLNNI